MTKKGTSIVILGPQGSGKGTQAEILAQKYNLRHIDMGDLLRKFVRTKHPKAAQVRRIMNTGSGLIPNNIVLEILEKEIKRISEKKGILFDGFPRNITQARALDRILKQQGRTIEHVIYLPISKKTTIARLAKRHREDDTPAAISKRLATYNKKTRPVIAYYRDRGVLTTIDGEPAVPLVTKSIFQKIDL